ncbi:hypothetical protein CBL_05914 [Carabus blaptoides fortunei]
MDGFWGCAASMGRILWEIHIQRSLMGSTLRISKNREENCLSVWELSNYSYSSIGDWFPGNSTLNVMFPSSGKGWSNLFSALSVRSARIQKYKEMRPDWLKRRSVTCRSQRNQDFQWPLNERRSLIRFCRNLHDRNASP